MSRHRNDPGGGLRIFFAVAAVVVMLALAVLGGYSLITALNTAPARTEPSAPASSAAPAPARSTPAQPPALTITATGPGVQVFVSTPGNQSILVDRTLRQGETITVDEPALQVVVSDGGAADITVFGRKRTPGAPGQRLEFTIKSSEFAFSENDQ